MAGVRVIRFLRRLLDVDNTAIAAGKMLQVRASVPGEVGHPTLIHEYVDMPVGVTDHGGLEGLADDDHPQYLLTAEGDARYWPLGTDLATQVELNTEAASRAAADAAMAAAAVNDGDAAGGVLSGTYPNPGFAVDMATQAELDALAAAAAAADAAVQASINAHVADGTDAHDASAVSFVPTGTIGATDVQAAIAEVASEAAAAGAPNSADYLVGTAQAGLTSEIVVGATPGGELGGTWGAPTVDATHSGSSHAGVQAAAEATAAAALTAHTGDATDAHDASAVSVVPFTSIAATNVQAALEEIVAEASGGVTDHGALTGLADDDHPQYAIEADTVMDGDPAGGVLDGFYPDPGFAVDMATQAELDAHVTDASAAHAGTAISVSSVTLSGVGTDVQAVLEELDNLLDDHSARHENGGADEISIAGLDGTPVELTNHLSDPTDAHAGTAITNTPAGNVAATTLQAAINELDSEKAASSHAHAGEDITSGTVADARIASTIARDSEVATEISDQKRVIEILVTDPAGAAITTGDGKAYVSIPNIMNGHNLVAVAAALTTVSSSGIPTVQIANVTQAADMLTTKLTIDASELHSKDAAAAAVIDAANGDVAYGDLLRVDIDVAGTGAKGLIVILTFEAP